MTNLRDASLHGNEIINSPYGAIELEHTYVTDESSVKLFDAMDFQRACQAYIWSIPLVSAVTWRDEQNRNYGTGEQGVFAVLSSLKEKRGIVTANLTTPYILAFNNLGEGPLAVDYPAGQTAGAFLDFWQKPIIDTGFTGPDQAQGGKYLILGPNDDPGKYEGSEAFVYQSPTNNILFGFRILNPDPAFAKQFMASIKMGRFGEPLQHCSFNEGIDREWSATSRRGIEYWQALHAIIQEEPVREQDKVWMAMLEPLGIKKGEPFDPDARQTRILLDGAAMGELMARNIQINPRFAEPYWAGTFWYKCFDFSIPQITDTKVELDERTAWFYEAVTSSEGMVNPAVGKGQVYMTTKRDHNGNLLRADKTYKLHVPKDVPVRQFWSLTLYSENTRRPYDNGGTGERSTSLDSSMKDLQYNPDGSVDLYIGSEVPKGMESNFMKTVGEDGWFVIFRLYAPTGPFFDKSFALPDFEILD